MNMAQSSENRRYRFKIDAPPSLVSTVKSTVASLLRNVDFSGGDQISVDSEVRADGIYTQIKLANAEIWENFDAEITRSCYDQVDWDQRVKARVRLGMKTLLCQSLGLAFSPWGILVGVRPTKLVQRFIDRGFTEDHIRSLLTDVYQIKQSRQQLLFDVIQKQRKFFRPDVNNPVSIYIGIPFCPTRCGYCSFAAYPLQSHGHLMANFLEALEQEIISFIQEFGIKVESVYLGGGTPTTVTGTALSRLLEHLNHYFNADHCLEYTVEAGRPETLTKETLGIMREHGVQRISINPQTMHDRTLKLLGRRHSASEIRSAFALAHQYGFEHINADLILGLPGEDETDFESSLKELVELQPNNITIHSLALKRASSFGKTIPKLAMKQESGSAMAGFARAFLEEMKLYPYYLYRQRFIAGGLENIGYAKTGTESIYNIQMMEERQTIIGLGGGAITKLISPDLSVDRHANPKCPGTYTQQIGDIIRTKNIQLRQHFTV